MKLDERQIEFISKLFPNECAGANTIARKLISTGKCIVAGSDRIWRGGIGNFITDKPAENAIDCTELTFNFQSFISSELFKDIIQNELLQIQEAIKELKKQEMSIAKLIRK